MFARVTITKAPGRTIDEITKIMQESVIPTAKAQKGFRGAYCLGNRQTGKEITISLWDTEEDAIANEQSGYYQEQVQKLTPYFTEEPVMEGYEELVQS